MSQTILNQLKNPLSRKEKAAYTEWQCDFMFQRLKIGLIITAVSLLTFILLNLSIDPQRESQIAQAWLLTNIAQEIAVLCCLALLYTPIGCTYPALIFLGFSWSMALIPHAQSAQFNTAIFDLITWTLTFLGLATLVPVRWRLHLLSQIGVFLHFLVMFIWFDVRMGTLISIPDLIIYLYLFWFCVICDLAVYLYERLQQFEFQANLKLTGKNIALQAEQNKSEHLLLSLQAKHQMLQEEQEKTERLLLTLRVRHELLQAEQEKSERLLLNVLPESIANRLKQQDQIIADHFTDVTVLFADIVGFTELSTRLSATQLVTLLNDIFSIFDKLIEKQGLEKIKTIGDAYMVVAGLPTPRTDHITSIADLALDMLQAIADFNGQQHDKLNIRIGIHTGPVVAGVIGLKKFSYDLWGDTVNTASRMESHGMTGRIQVTECVYHTLKDKYLLVKRGTIQVKGKGEMTTYFLESKRQNSINVSSI
ncbi:MAG: adenylate/guanylate cyclase domain-containing protein [Candidatus Parabeggiatoa sp.]|nr:adenylate/guanylate cyclase domain-containing protein [Candidatus Parabeggiatoa sp.]